MRGIWRKMHDIMHKAHDITQFYTVITHKYFVKYTKMRHLRIHVHVNLMNIFSWEQQDTYLLRKCFPVCSAVH